MFCKSCGGPVTSHHEAFQIEHPVRDERGRFIYKTVVDKKTGARSEQQVTIKVDARGLGHWSCVRGCPKRKGVKLFQLDSNNSGKECERKMQGVPWNTDRDIVVVNGRNV
jgi:hypothetical protein